MPNLTKTETSHLKELQDLKQEVSLLQEKDRLSAVQIDSLKKQLASHQLDQERNRSIKYHTLFENSPVAIFRTDAHSGEILYANLMVWKILECDPNEISNALNFYSNPEDRANMVQDLMANGKVVDREVQIKKATGDPVWVTISALYYPDEGAVEGVMMDISRIKESVLELQKANYELDNFVYHASHDLRAPLRSIMGLINVMRLEKTTSGKEHCLEMIEGSIKRLDNLVIDLLQISRGSRASNTMDDICMVSEVNNSITNFAHVEDSEDIRIITGIRQPVRFVSDLTRIRIVLNNIISNAIKYRKLNQGQSFIAVHVRVSTRRMEITVEDNGQGIPSSKLSSIFDMFVRATDNQQGSGLGLYIVKNVVEKLRGRISVESDEYIGSKFKIVLPNLAT
jgi:signal transduction histidine kinase